MIQRMPPNKAGKTCKITSSQQITLDRPAAHQRIFLDLDRLHGTLAIVRLNGKEAGAVLWAAYRLELTGLTRAGANHLEIDLINSLRDLLGPHHYTGPQKNEQWGWSYSGYPEKVNWMDNQVRGTLKTRSYAYEFVPFGLSEIARIVYEE